MISTLVSRWLVFPTRFDNREIWWTEKSGSCVELYESRSISSGVVLKQVDRVKGD
jgi:hypothetical protein